MRKMRLSPAYDLVSTMVYESSSEEMAMGVGGEYNIYKISRRSFEAEAENVGLAL